MDDNKFSLGFDGEKWSAFLGALVVPVGTSRQLLVRRRRDRSGTVWYHIYHSTSLRSTDNLLMVAAYVQETIDKHRSD